jgi:Flp pilus assembly protein TadD
MAGADATIPADGDTRLLGLPARAQALRQDAAEALQSHQAPRAEQSLVAALALAPEHPELLRLLAVALRVQNRNAEALQFARRAAMLRPEDALIQNGLGTALEAAGDSDGAITAFRRACELAPQSAQLWANLGQSLVSHGRFEEALPVLQRAARMFDHVATHLRLGYALRVLGHTDAAARQYRDIIARRPTDAQAWIGLANLRTRMFAADDIVAMREALQAARSSEDRGALGFALAKALDDHGRYDEAFAALVQANRVCRDRQRWNAAEFSNLATAVRTAFPEAAVGAPVGQGGEVIFMVGMPRSGSSLLEQMLASHPMVQGAGELTALDAVVGAESQRRQQAFPQWVAAMTPADWQRLGEQYLERTARWRRDSTIFVDKLPGNWLRVGAALAMLPGARVIECRRAALETCFSCYRTLFAEGFQTFSYDLQDLAAYWRDCDSTCRHWRTLYPTRFRTQHYEQLIADPETQIAQVLEFCGLPYAEACARFHETPRAVRTASASQVREPLMRDTAKAERYGTLLDSLRAALGDHVD